MRAETIPLILGALVGLMGVALVLDAQLPDYTVVKRERRRRQRIERSRGGEMLLGLAMLAFAAALIGRDTWRYRILAVIVSVVCLILGTIANRAFIREAIVNRGALRRDPAHPIKPGMPTDAGGGQTGTRGTRVREGGGERRHSPPSTLHPPPSLP